MSRNWTGEQKAAIDYNGSAIVSAGAGSGKTAVLVERVTKMLTDPDNPVYADRIAVITFTNKAANEMKERLTTAVSNILEKDPGNAFLQKQQILLQTANISTISSFCLNILRENIQSLPFGYGFTTLDANSADILMKKALDKTLESFYESGKSSDIFEYFCVRGDKQLCEAVITLYNFTRNLPSPAEWILQQKESYKNPSSIYNKLNEVNQKRVYRKFDDILSLANTNSDFAANYGNSKLIDLCTKDLSCVNKLISELHNGNIINAVDTFKLSILPRNVFSDATLKKQFSDNRTAIKDKVKELRDSLFTAERFEQTSKKQYPVISGLFDILELFEVEYTKLKINKNAVDFSDIEYYTLNLLRNSGMTTEKYDLIIVDEFQDSNDVQFEIFKLLSDNEKNLYFVGDVKQSIYAFRGANPKVFSQLCENDKYKYLPLNKNFRSRIEVIESINSMLMDSFTKKTGGADYKNNNALVPGGKFCTGKSDYSTEIYLINKKDADENKSAEAAFVAEKIKDMLNGGFEVSENGILRKCKADDFCILMRSTNNYAKAYTDELKKRGIDAVSDDARDYFGLQEISLIISFLEVIDNPMSDKSLLNVLMSPLYGIDADTMAMIRVGTLGLDVENTDESVLEALNKSYRWSKLYACILRLSKPTDLKTELYGFSDEETEKLQALALSCKMRDTGDKILQKIIHDIRTLRDYAANNTVERLIRKIYDATEFFSVMSVYELGEQKLANLRLLLQYANDFESNGGGLSDFLRYINNLKALKRDFGQVKITGTNGCGVHIMTIHGSKGLEFPICFLSGCGKMFNKIDMKKDYIFDAELGVCMKYIDRRKLIKAPTLPFSAAAANKEQALKSEEMRLLYVAMTRAKEKLIITAETDIRVYENFLEGKVITDEQSAEKYTDWLLMSLAKNNSKNVKVEYVLSFNVSEVDDIIQEDIEKVNADEKISNEITANLNFIYPYTMQVKIPSKLTVTELAKNSDYGVYLRKPSFMRSQRLTGKELGDAYHKFMEHVNFKAASVSVSQEIQKLYETEILSPKQANSIDIKKLETFINGELGQRIASSNKIYREYKIFTEVNATDLHYNSDDKIVLQGISDLIFEENDYLVLVDYKSDVVSNMNKLVETYKYQLILYKNALEKLFNKSVKQCIIYSFHLGESIEITP